MLRKAGVGLEVLEARVRRLQDLDAIETLKARYWRGVDLKRPEAVLDCLVPEAVVDFEGLPRFDNREAFMAVVRQGAARPQAFDMHHGHNPCIQLTGGDDAAGSWDIFYYGIDLAARTLVQMAGIYQDRYVRRAGRWWIASTIMRQTSLHVQSVDDLGAARTVILGRAERGLSFRTQADPA